MREGRQARRAASDGETVTLRTWIPGARPSAIQLPAPRRYKSHWRPYRSCRRRARNERRPIEDAFGRVKYDRRSRHPGIGAERYHLPGAPHPPSRFGRGRAASSTQNHDAGERQRHQDGSKCRAAERQPKRTMDQSITPVTPADWLKRDARNKRDLIPVSQRPTSPSIDTCGEEDCPPCRNTQKER
jgi:hypothetical protein